MESLTYEDLIKEVSELKIKISQMEKEKEEIFTTIPKYYIQVAYNRLKGLDENTDLLDNVWKKVKDLESDWNLEMLDVKDVEAFLDSYYKDI